MRRSVLALLLLAALPSLAAEYEIVPQAPTSRTPVTVQVRTIWRDGCLPINPAITRNGSTVTITWSLPQGRGCTLAVRPWSDDVNLGTFNPGVYDAVLRVDDITGMRTLAQLKLIVTEAEPALVVQPRVVSSRGQTEVKITTPGGFCSRNLLSVTVGVPVTARMQNCEIVATLPAQAPGVYDAEVRVDGRVYTAKFAVRYADPAAAPDPAEYERVLIPVLYEGPGAFGSHWTVDTVMINVSPNDFLAVAEVAAPMPRLAAGATSPNLLTIFGVRPVGLVLFVPRGQDVRFGNVIRDVSREASQWGTEVPVARESDARSEIVLPNIPFDKRYRLQLRIYGLDGVGFPVSLAGGGLFRTIELQGPCTAEQAPCNSNRPAYASADLQQLLPALSKPATLRITSLDHAHKLWAFVTVTNNDTQQVTVISPQ